MKKFAVIVGGGKGMRLGSEIPKQFLPLNGQPVIFHTIEKFSGITDEIVVVLPESHFEYWQQLCNTHQPAFTVRLVAGGDSRAQSVTNGLAALTGEGVVAIHDAVRPLISKSLIASLFEAAKIHGNAVPVIPLKESIRLKNGKAVKRDEFVVVQTPQCFDLQQLKNAYESAVGMEFSDDAGLFEYFGATIRQVEGDTSNIKITFKEDLIIAATLMNAINL